MIFLNRRRTPLNQETTKDPSKYWYVEKYVYGELKETIEVPLKTSTKFTAIKSGYLDDLFHGWSINSASTTITFNDTSSYVNTNSNVKKYFDSNNTIKLYAVYAYSTVTITTDNASVAGSNDTANIVATGIFIATADGTIDVYGNTTKATQTIVNGSTTKTDTTYGNVSIDITDADDVKTTVSVNIKTGSKKTNAIKTGDVISYTVIGKMLKSVNQGNGTVTIDSAYISFNSSVPLYDLKSSPKYRVESHTA